MIPEEWQTDALLRNEPCGEVFVLGAGFSKAVDDRFPVTDALGQLAMAARDVGMLQPPRWGDHRVTLGQLGAALRKDWGTFQGGSFEAWLSQLAEPQPYLSHAQNLANRAQFAELVRAIWEVISLIEVEVCRGGLPAWLYRFVSTLHARQATVITFNYDRLIETAVDGADIHRFDGPFDEQQVIWSHLLDGVPALPPMPGQRARDPISTFRLCKLHGSLNWYWVPDDSTGLTLNAWHLDDGEDRARHLPGREPFLVPPASAKSGYFMNPVMSEIWRRSYVALEAAQSAIFVGYSLPLTDLTAAGLFSRTIGGTPHSSVVVNLHPDDVAARVAQLTGQQVVSHLSVEDFVDGFVHDVSAHLGARCRASSAPTDTRLVVGWSRQMTAKVRSVVKERAKVVVEVAEFDGSATMTVQGPDGPEEDALARPYRELQAALREGDVIVVRFANGRESPVVGIDGFVAGAGAAKFWQVLMPADRAADLGVGYMPRIGVPK